MYISIVTLFADDLDRAINFYTEKFGWIKTMDVPMGEGARWVTVAPSSEGQTAFNLAKSGEYGTAGGMSRVILEVEDVYQTHEALAKLGVEFTEAPRTEPWGGWAMLKDSEGNVHGLHSTAAAGAGN